MKSQLCQLLWQEKTELVKAKNYEDQCFHEMDKIMDERIQYLCHTGGNPRPERRRTGCLVVETTAMMKSSTIKLSSPG